MSNPNSSPEYSAESRLTALYVGWSIPIPLMIISTALRLWAELHHHGRSLLLDDYLMILATIASIAQCLYGIFGPPSYGLGKHIEAMPPDHYEGYRLAGYIFAQLSQVALGLTKLAVLALYYRVFPTTRMRRAVITVASLVTIWLVSMEIVYFLFCTPFEKIWHRNMNGTCLDAVAADKAQIGANLGLDVLIFLLPLPIIARMRNPTTKKIGMVLLFTIGFVTCFISGARLVLANIDLGYDTSWQMVPIMIMAVYEPLGSILCANLPLTYKPVLTGLGGVFGKQDPFALPPDDGPSTWYHVHRKFRREGRKKAMRGGMETTTKARTLIASGSLQDAGGLLWEKGPAVQRSETLNYKSQTA
ncbi:hypothetical protein BDV19DRAFT_315365 [Aspergillus venezuelensis]